MAKYLRYQGEFLSVAGVLWRVELHQENDTAFATVGVLEFPADEPLTLEWASTAKEEVISGATATLKIISPSDRTYEDLYSVEVGRVRLDVYRNNVLWWSGCLDTEFYEEPYEAASGYEVSLTFSDFGVLDRLKYDLSGLRTLQEIIVAATDRAGLNVMTIDDSLISTMLDANTRLKLDGLKVRSDNFYDEDGEASSFAEVLVGVLQPLGLKITQRSGSIRVYDLNALATVAPRVAITWDGSSQTMGVDRVYNNAKVTWSTYAQEGNLLPSECWPEDIDTPPDTTALNTNEGRATASAQYWSYHYSNNLDDWNYSEDIGFTLWTTKRGNNAELLDSRARFFRIVPQNDGSEAEGVAVYWTGVNGGYRAADGYFIEWLPFGAEGLAGDVGSIGTPLFKSQPVWLPPVDRPRDLLIRLRLEALIDVRFNPFESAEKIMGSEDQKSFSDKFNTYGNYVYIPVRVKFQPDGSDDIYTWSNEDIVATRNGLPFVVMWRTTGEWRKGDSHKGYLSYYDPSDREGKCGVLGWQTNRQAINPHLYGLHSSLSNTDAGQYISYPTVGRGGKLWVEVYNDGWRFIDGGEDFNTDTNGKKSIISNLRWVLFKLPEVELLNNLQFGRAIDTSDVEYAAELNTAAKEPIELTTLCGTSAEGIPTARGAYFDAATGKQIKTLTRAGRTTQAEDLLIGTLYSQYAERRTTLSGEAQLLTMPVAAYTEANQPGKVFIAVEDMQNARMDTSEATFIELRPDEYKRNNE